jgi:hypothetical protein
LYAGLNAVKPLQVDDAAYLYFARQIAQKPLDPYGFSFQWYSTPDRANEILAPPILLYWLGAAVRLGDQPWLWKLMLLPWSLLFVGSLYALFRRFARGLELALTWFTVLSPAFLPALNLMLDVPALGLVLASVALFLRACDQRSFGLAALAGLLAGMGMETKYTAILALMAMLLAAILQRQLLLGLVAACVAGQTFATWELLTSLLYGKSHFFMALDQPGRQADPEIGWLFEKLQRLPALLSILGSVGAAGLLLGLAALGVGRKTLLAAAGALGLGYLVIAVFDFQFRGMLSARVFGAKAELSLYGQHAEVVFYGVALVGLLVLGAVIGKLWTLAGDAEQGVHFPRRDTLFLVLWLGLEGAFYFPMTDFPAVRRVLGIGVVLMLLLGRLAAATCRSRERRQVLAAVWAVGIALGLGHFALDCREAWVIKRATETARDWIAEQGGGRTWYLGHWSFQFYAERLGMEPLVVDYNWHESYLPEGEGIKPAEVALPEPSRLRAGDWLVVPTRIDRQTMKMDEGQLRPEFSFFFDDPVPLRTIWNYYGGEAALEHHEGPRMEVTIYRVLTDFTPVRNDK